MHNEWFGSINHPRLQLLNRLSKEAKEFRDPPKLIQGKAVPSETVPILSKELISMDGIETYILLLEAIKGRVWLNHDPSFRISPSGHP